MIENASVALHPNFRAYKDDYGFQTSARNFLCHGQCRPPVVCFQFVGVQRGFRQPSRNISPNTPGEPTLEEEVHSNLRNPAAKYTS
jgi:hypothetical protein